jgi:uncharacterized membrane protein YeaQ/YmgE (transglycosylase-associated protein family)
MNRMSFDFGSVVSWLVLGVVAGLIVHMIDSREVRGGVLATSLTGVIGAILGGLISSLFFDLGVTGFNIISLLISIIGGLIFAVSQRMIMSFQDQEIPQIKPNQSSSYEPAYFTQVTPLRTDEEEKLRRNKSREKVKSGGRNAQIIDPIKVEKFLDGIDFPAHKQELLKVAVDNGADDNVVYTIEQLAEKKYQSPKEVSQELEMLD